MNDTNHVEPDKSVRVLGHRLLSNDLDERVNNVGDAWPARFGQVSVFPIVVGLVLAVATSTTSFRQEHIEE